MYFTVITVLLLCVKVQTTYSAEIEAKNYEALLLRTIFDGYDERARPVKHYQTPVVVGFGLELQQIIQVDEKHQVIIATFLRSLRWTDELLQWKPEHYGNVTQVWEK